MSWFLDQFVNAVLQLCIAFVAFMTNQLVQPLSLSPDVILTYFPSITDFSLAFKILGIFLTVIIVLFQLFRVIFGNFSYGEKDNVIVLLLRSGLAIALVLNSMSMMSYVFDTFSQPFYVLEGESGQKAFDVTEGEDSLFKRSVNEAFAAFFESAENIKEEEYSDALTRIKDWIFPGVSILKALIEIVCILLIGYKFIMYLLEILGRYLIIMLQAFTSPLAWPCMSSVSTSGIFKKWIEMFISNFLLVYFNMWMLGLIINSMGTIFNPDTSLLAGSGWEPNFFLGSCLVYTFLKIAQSMDTYLAKLVATSTTGSGIAQEIIMTLRVFQNAFHKARHISGTENSNRDTFYQLGDSASDPPPTGPQETYREREINRYTTDQNTVNKQDVEVPTANTDKSAFVTKVLDPEEFYQVYGIDQDAVEAALGEEQIPSKVSREEDGSFLIESHVTGSTEKAGTRLVPITEHSSNDETYTTYQQLVSESGQHYLVIPETKSGGKLLTSSEHFSSTGESLKRENSLSTLDTLLERETEKIPASKAVSLPKRESVLSTENEALPQFKEVKT